MNDLLEFGLGSAKSGVYASYAVIPECQILFAGPAVCTRHDILTSMVQVKDKIAHLCLDETDIVTGGYVELIEEAAGELVREAGAKALILVTCCENALIGTDFEMLTSAIGKKFGIPVECVQINRLNMYRARKGAKTISRNINELIAGFLKTAAAEDGPRRDNGVNLLGPVQPLSPKNELARLLKPAGAELRHVSLCGTYDDFKKMARASLNIVTEPEAVGAAREMEKTLGIPWLDMSYTVSLPAVKEQYAHLAEALNVELFYEDRAAMTERLLHRTRRLLGDTPISVDGRKLTHPFTVAKALIDEGFHVGEIRIDEFVAEETDCKNWVTQNTAVPVTFVSSRNQSNTIRKDHFCALLEVRRGQPGEFFTGFALIDRLLEALTAAYNGRMRISEEIVEKAAAPGA